VILPNTSTGQVTVQGAPQNQRFILIQKPGNAPTGVPFQASQSGTPVYVLKQPGGNPGQQQVDIFCFFKFITSFLDHFYPSEYANSTVTSSNFGCT
jgi:hypothetical protein